MKVIRGMKTLVSYPSALVGVLIITGLVILALYAVFSIPYSEAIRLWRAGESTWIENPRTALPRWVNWFGADLPETIKVTAAQQATGFEDLGGGVRRYTTALAFDYSSRNFPGELSVFWVPKYDKNAPFVNLAWMTPDGRVVPLANQKAQMASRYVVSGDTLLEKKLGRNVVEALFADPTSSQSALRGRYQLLCEVYLFEPESSVDVKLVVYGRVHGWAGTDHLRRDLSIALLWGAPIGMIFGLFAAIGISLGQFLISGIGAWYGGVIDIFVERLTELRMILPLLPILIMVGMFWSRSLWTVLAVLVSFYIIGGSKTYRAMFLQAREAAYIEAAKAYGAGNMRIVFRYLLPRLIPVLIPEFVLAVPSFVFLEATLAVLGLGDPLLPTWGKIIEDAYSQGALYRGLYYWLLEPAALLMLTGLGFSMLGFTLDRIFNPRLRTL